MVCKYCEGIKYKVYEDKDIICFLDENPVSIGHLVLIPKEHYVILEQVPDEITGKLFDMANKLSSILFEVLEIQGTNTIINNGVEQEVPHVSLNIIPRTGKDEFNFEWKPIKVSDDKLDVLVHNLKNGLKEKPKPKEEKPKVEKISKEKSSWIDKAMNRIP